MAAEPRNLRTTAFPAPGDPDASTALRHRRIIYAISSIVLALVMASLVVDAASEDLAIWGVESRVVVDRQPGVELAVQHTEVARPGLAAPLRVTVTRDGGFDDDIEIGIPARYLALWDLNGLYPEPKDTRSEGERVVFTFDPPEGGDRFEWLLDWRIEPAVQAGRSGYVAVLDGGQPEAIVRFHTRVMP